MTQQSKQLRRFNRLVGETDAVYHELANRLGLSDSAFQILYTLRAEGGACPLRDICAFSGLTKQTVNSALRKLEGQRHDRKQRRPAQDGHAHAEGSGACGKNRGKGDRDRKRDPWLMAGRGS